MLEQYLSDTVVTASQALSSDYSLSPIDCVSIYILNNQALQSNIYVVLRRSSESGDRYLLAPSSLVYPLTWADCSFLVPSSFRDTMKFFLNFVFIHRLDFTLDPRFQLRTI